MAERGIHPTDWLVDIHPHATPTLRARDDTERHREARLMALWSRYPFLTRDDSSDDYEDTLEEAARLDAALTAFGDANVWLAQHYDGVMMHAVTGETRPVWDGLGLRRYGGQPRESQYPELLTERTANTYASFGTFQRHARRPVILAGVDAPGADLYETIRQLAAAGHHRQFLKVNTTAKYATQFLDVPTDPTNKQISEAFDEGIFWSLVHLEGLAGAYQVQPFTEMVFEYRLFIIDGRPVAGAGCIEEFTPAQNRGDRFDTRVREHRHRGSAVIDDADIVDELVGFGTAVAGELLRERPDLPCYGMDVAIGPGGRPLMIEINGLLNCGLYASAPRLVTTALARRPLDPNEQRVFDPRIGATRL